MTAVLDRLSVYGDVTKQGTLVYVAIPVICKTTRIQVLEQILADIKAGGIFAEMRHDRPDYSSIGYVLAENLKIMVKSARQQGSGSAGLTNENFLIDQIHKYIASNSKNSMLRFVSAANGREVVLRDIRDCLANENKKTKQGQNKVDMLLNVGGKNLNFSIKKSGAERWQSADTYYGKLARHKLDFAISRGLTRFTLATGRDGESIYRGGNLMTPVYRLEPELFWTMQEEEKIDMIYGKDVDYVIRGDYDGGRIEMVSDGSMRILCDTMYSRGEPIAGDEEPCWMIRNDATRNCLALGVAGLRVEAVCRSRTIYGVEVKDV